MKKMASLIILSTLTLACFAIKYAKAGYADRTRYYSDGIDKRIAQVKNYLSKKLSKKEFLALSFSEAVIHTKDSADFYLKIPFADKKYPGFILVKKKENKFQYVKIKIEGYAYNIKRLNYKNALQVEISSKETALNKKFIMYGSGWVKKMSVPIPANGIRDTGFSVTPFLGYGSVKPGRPDSLSLKVTFEQFEAYINTNFVFERIDKLNYDKLYTKVLVHDMIPLAFVPEPSFEMEFSNSDILPAIDLKEAFKKFNAPADTLKHNR